MKVNNEVDINEFDNITAIKPEPTKVAEKLPTRFTLYVTRSGKWVLTRYNLNITYINNKPVCQFNVLGVEFVKDFADLARVITGYWYADRSLNMQVSAFVLNQEVLLQLRKNRSWYVEVTSQRPGKTGKYRVNGVVTLSTEQGNKPAHRVATSIMQLIQLVKDNKSARPIAELMYDYTNMTRAEKLATSKQVKSLVQELI